MQASPAKTYLMELTNRDLPEADWTCSLIVGKACQLLQVVLHARHLGVIIRGRPVYQSLQGSAQRPCGLGLSCTDLQRQHTSEMI